MNWVYGILWSIGFYLWFKAGRATVKRLNKGGKEVIYDFIDLYFPKHGDWLIVAFYVVCVLFGLLAFVAYLAGLFVALSFVERKVRQMDGPQIKAWMIRRGHPLPTETEAEKWARERNERKQQ